VSVSDLSDSDRAEDVSAGLICDARGVHHQYGDHVALNGVDYVARAGEVSALLGPNGSGKTTLFRLLCTLLPLQRGQITIAGMDAARDPLAVRRQIGIVFQSPSLDKKLTVEENIACQGALYGITGTELKRRRDELLAEFQLADRRRDLCESLSGGLKRRVELAKGMLHRPALLLLDEPSTGLDPAARLGLWQSLTEMAARGTAVILTTHLLEEADKADRVAILAQGSVIAEGTPGQLRAEMGQGIITIVSNEIEAVQRLLRDELGLDPQRMHHQLRLQSQQPAALVPKLAETLGDRAQSISIGRPSLEDVFIAKTGDLFQ
jgi:ABC-2 type transport system ATP-binding protein